MRMTIQKEKIIFALYLSILFGCVHAVALAERIPFCGSLSTQGVGFALPWALGCWAFSPGLGFDFISVVMRLKWGCEGHFDPERVAPC